MARLLLQLVIESDARGDEAFRLLTHAAMVKREFGGIGETEKGLLSGRVLGAAFQVSAGGTIQIVLPSSAIPAYDPPRMFHESLGMILSVVRILRESLPPSTRYKLRSIYLGVQLLGLASMLGIDIDRLMPWLANEVKFELDTSGEYRAFAERIARNPRLSMKLERGRVLTMSYPIAVEVNLIVRGEANLKYGIGYEYKTTPKIEERRIIMYPGWISFICERWSIIPLTDSVEVIGRQLIPPLIHEE
ncbi:MAG: hypothetical protein QW711_04620 [Candidatus Korarchaeum sp.]